MAGDRGARLRRPVDDDDPALVDDDPRDPHLNRVMPGGRSWPKREHLANIQRSGWFGYCRELVFDEPAGGGAERFVALLRSQGSYQGLIKAGLTDDDLGVPAFETAVADAYRRRRRRRRDVVLLARPARRPPPMTEPVSGLVIDVGRPASRRT